MAARPIRRVAVLAIAGIWFVVHGQAQEPPTPQPETQQQSPAPAEPPQPAEPAKTQLFHGIVSSIAKDRVTISRQLVGHDPETRVFMIDAGTKKPKAIRVKSDVIVRYVQRDDQDVAIEIHVHPRHLFHNSDPDQAK